MKKEEIKQIEELIEEIKNEWGDWEVTHSDYDKILRIIARNHEPKLMKRIDKLMKKASFWFA